MSIREAPPAFVARLRAAFSDFIDLRYNVTVHRWEYVSLSSANKQVSQFWGWFKNPLTGKVIEADPVTGLLPFRDLDLTAQEEMFANLERSFIGNRADGQGTHRAQQAAHRKFNTDLLAKRRMERANLITDILMDVPTGRAWVKDHPHAKDPRRQRMASHA